MIFGLNFKKYRKKKGISQRQFAQMLYEITGKRLTLTSVSNYETGLHMPPTQILPAIADILEVSIDALFGKEETAEEELAVDTPHAIEESLALKEWKMELDSLEKEFIQWRIRHATSQDAPVQLLASQCEKLLELAKSQQEELVILQTELSTIRELISFFKK